MGIRFLCPNGHKLHVKSFLAGKRAICPQCGARVLVPPESSAPDSGTSSTASIELPTDLDVIRAAVGANPTDAAKLADTAPAASPGTATTSGTDTTPDPIGAAPGAVWYVRPGSGGQYGPASGEILRSWIDEGRVGAGALVWRAGWEQWRSANEVFPQLSGQIGAPTQPLPPAAENSSSTVPPRVRPVQVLPAEPEPAASSTSTALPQLMRKKRRRNEVSLMASGVLAVVSLILVIVLLLVFRYQSAPIPPENAEAPAAKQ